MLPLRRCRDALLGLGAERYAETLDGQQIGNNRFPRSVNITHTHRHTRAHTHMRT